MLLTYHAKPIRTITPEIRSDGVYFNGFLLDPQYLRSVPVALEFEGIEEYSTAFGLIEKCSLEPLKARK